MFKRLLGLLLCGGGMVALLSSCGGGGVGGGVGEFTTVNATATASTPRIESDLITGNACTGNVTSGGTFGTDTTTVDVKSTALFSTGALDLKISKITVSYFPVTVNSVTPPALDPFVNYVGYVVGPGGSVTIPVTVVPDSYKVALSSNSLQACSTTVYEYIARITFEVSEIGGNGKPRNVTTDLNIAIADRAS